MPLDYNSLAQAYALHRQVMPEVLQGLVDGSFLNAASRVLDVGCGTGNYTIAVEQASAASCWGCDPSEQMLGKAQGRSQKAIFQLGKAEQLDFPDEFFDLVFSVDVIHHVGDRAAFYRQAFRVLKPGGKVCTVTDSEDIIRRRQPLSEYFPETIPAELARYPRIADLRQMMLDAGFSGLDECQVEHPYNLSDAGPYRAKAYSSLHLIPTEAFERGIRRMQQDLEQQPIQAVARYLLLWGNKNPTPSE